MTVREWFRQMRAADFERDVALISAESHGSFFIVAPMLLPWTLFDTQDVVDRLGLRGDPASTEDAARALPDRP